VNSKTGDSPPKNIISCEDMIHSLKQSKESNSTGVEEIMLIPLSFKVVEMVSPATFASLDAPNRGSFLPLKSSQCIVCSVCSM